MAKGSDLSEDARKAFAQAMRGYKVVARVPTIDITHQQWQRISLIVRELNDLKAAFQGRPVESVILTGSSLREVFEAAFDLKLILN